MSDSTLPTTAERERLLLAPFALHSSDSQGRRYDEQEHPYRGPFQRDRDRILHSAAFRRLSGKMQVFTGDRGDYHRTRLTHTHEVASIARTLGRGLRLNEDLIEALAFFHDIGHPPFGHAGEDALAECMSAQGGFSHNQHALTIAEELEVRYPAFPGLNLTAEVLDGQRVRANKDSPTMRPLLEVQLVDLADSITYNAHDTDDAVKLKLVTIDELSEIELVRESLEWIHQQHANLTDEYLRMSLVHQLLDCQVSDVLDHCAGELTRAGFATAEEARAFQLRESPELAEKKKALERFLYERVYRHPELIEVRSRAQQQLRQMFERLCQRPDLLPSRFQERARQYGVPRSVTDYIAGMTDRFCTNMYKRLFE